MDYERVIFSTWALSSESALVLGDVIRRLPHLRSLVISDIIAGRPDAEGIAVYRALSAAMEGRLVEEVDLSDNALGLRGVDACGNILKGQTSLKRLYFNNNGISSEAARGIADLVLCKVPTQLRILHFSNNMSGGGGSIAIADIVSASPNLEDFKFESSRGTQVGGEALARALAATPALKRLSLHDNLFGATSAATLALSLASHASLTWLDLGDIIMRDGGICAMVRAMPGWVAPLEFLDVSENDLGPVGGAALALALAHYLPGLRVLKAQGNAFEEEGGKAVCGGLIKRREALNGKSDPLCDVNFSACSLGSKIACLLVRLAVANLPSLKYIDISENEITPSSLELAKNFVASAGLPADTLVCDEGEGGEEEEEEGLDPTPSQLLSIEALEKFAAKEGVRPGIPTKSDMDAVKAGLQAGALCL